MVGVDDPEDFWLPALGDRFSLLPWHMPRVRIAHYEAMLTDLKKRVSF